MLNFCDFIQVYVFTTNHHLKFRNVHDRTSVFVNKINTDRQVYTSIYFVQAVSRFQSSIHGIGGYY